MAGQNVGQILWTDLTVPNAEEVRKFYGAVIGWKFDAVSMGDYSDFTMIAPDGPPQKPEEQATVVTGICHARGDNADIPPQWLNYFGVSNLDASRKAVEKHGGKLVTSIKSYGTDRFCVIEDPAGAVCGLFESNPKQET